MGWKETARMEVARAASSPGHDDAPVFLVPVPRKWWEFWRPVRYVEWRGMSRSAGERLQRALSRIEPPA